MSFQEVEDLFRSYLGSGTSIRHDHYRGFTSLTNGRSILPLRHTHCNWFSQRNEERNDLYSYKSFQTINLFQF